MHEICVQKMNVRLILLSWAFCYSSKATQKCLVVLTYMSSEHCTSSIQLMCKNMDCSEMFQVVPLAVYDCSIVPTSWLHLFAFLLFQSYCFKRRSDWMMILHSIIESAVEPEYFNKCYGNFSFQSMTWNKLHVWKNMKMYADKCS